MEYGGGMGEEMGVVVLLNPGVGVEEPWRSFETKRIEGLSVDCFL